ncbi:MAG: hypothetical protein LBT78_07910 [Tannerella sp.]|jgi:hypothetical protein|nr:hypothetical protein [Tannerella sp.]
MYFSNSAKGCRPHVFWEIQHHSHHSEQSKIVKNIGSKITEKKMILQKKEMIFFRQGGHAPLLYFPRDDFVHETPSALPVNNPQIHLGGCDVMKPPTL